MPFNTVRSNAREMFNEVFINLSFIESNERSNAASIEVKILRGLFHVHLYSALEKVINETIEQTILLISRQEVKNKHYKKIFNTISLNSKMQAFKQCSSKKYFQKATEVFESLESEKYLKLNNTALAENLQNIWHTTLQEAINSFGASPIDFSPRTILTINEIVEKRNSVAHGRETPVSVGERHRAKVLREKAQEIQIVVEKFILVFEDYIHNKEYISPEHLDEYRKA